MSGETSRPSTMTQTEEAELVRQLTQLHHAMMEQGQYNMGEPALWNRLQIFGECVLHLADVHKQQHMRKN